MNSYGLSVLPYDAPKAAEYAKKWAFERNPAYYDFHGLGGDCTNFISQCLYAGSGVMNFTPETGWYYLSLNSRAPAWTSARYLNRFLLNNQGAGPFAVSSSIGTIVPGDVVQLKSESGQIYHSLLAVKADRAAVPGQILVAAHTYDALNRPLNSYSYYEAVFLHIGGVRDYR